MHKQRDQKMQDKIKEFKSKKTNSRNTNSYIEWTVDALQSRNYPVLDSLEDAWQQIPSDDLIHSNKRESKSSFESPIFDFLSQIESGSFPPPEYLLSIAHCFELYLEHEGKLSLEDVFFGKPRKGKGNKAAQKSWDRLFQSFHNDLVFNLGDKEYKNLPERTEEWIYQWKSIHYQLNDGEMDVDSFLRSYRRWKKANNKDNQTP